MDQLNINHWAIIVCAASNLLVGAVWYSPLLFYKAWMKENKLTEESIMQTFNPLKMYGISFLFSLILSYTFALLIGYYATDALRGAVAGFATGFGLSGLIFSIIALFEQRSWKYILINGFYIIIYFTLIGCIIGIWK